MRLKQKLENFSVNNSELGSSTNDKARVITTQQKADNFNKLMKMIAEKSRWFFPHVCSTSVRSFIFLFH